MNEGNSEINNSLPNSPDELRQLAVTDLPEVCKALRQRIIDTLCCRPGHFASSMGAVEITVALHYVLNTPYDRIVWDVGHQSYAHKLLTGRADRFDTLRTEEGISGFPNPAESEYDTFTAGHASNSISAALGMSVADDLSGEDRHTVAVIGDASISGGLAFEGLNNVSNNPNNLLIILNDNNMSIDDNVGALHTYLSDLNTSAGYNRWRYKIYTFLKRHGIINEKRKGLMLRLNNSLKAFISGQQNIFEGLNIRYFGPFDGHDVGKLVKVLNDIKDMKGPRLLHIHTVKGKGFEAAEKDPATWHAPGKFDPKTGEIIKSNGNGEKKWQQVFGEKLVDLAKKDERVVGITAAMPSGTSMSMLLEAMPERTFDVGISEGHAVTFAGGLAAAGKKPFVAIYSSFLQRAYDNIIHDVAIAGLPVTFCIDRAGIVGEDGVTHHGMFDLCYLRPIPGLTIAAPSDAAMLEDVMEIALQHDSPMAIRYPRGTAWAPGYESHITEIGKGRILRHVPQAKVSILSLGSATADAMKAAEILRDAHIESNVFDMVWVKPLDTRYIDRAARAAHLVVTVEDGAVEGGFGSAVLEYMSSKNYDNKVIRLGAPDKWVQHGSVQSLKHKCGYDAETIASVVRNYLAK